MNAREPDPTLQIVLRSPDAIAAIMRSGGGSAEDLQIDRRLRERTGRGLAEWLDLLDDSQQHQFVRRLGNLLVLLDELEEQPLGSDPWPPPMSDERREYVLTGIGVPKRIAEAVQLENPLPHWTHASPLVWVDPNANPLHGRDFLDRTRGPRWRRYRSQLSEGMAWPGEDLRFLEQDLDQLVAAFPDPARGERSPRRLLVVGHTQSGKTANFLGLTARMCDAGTKLIVILSGRTRILRRQTQARVDRDLIGEDPTNLGLLRQEYPDGHRLLDRLARYPQDGTDVGWTRLTQRRYGRDIGGPVGRVRTDDDAYQRPQGGLASREQTRPMIAVLKKTPGDLQVFKEALVASPLAFRRLPAMVIDEEADEASLNYRAPKAPGGGWARVISDAERSTINRLISEILAQLEAGVYVGYTATPFANCFADADDEKGFFPHAIQVLGTPTGYFGASRVFDLLYDGPVGAVLPSAAHMRPIESDHDSERELDAALDDFILAGAVKLWRREKAAALGDSRARQRLRHHTMMVHIGTTRGEQRAIRDETRHRLFDRPGRGLGIMDPEATAARLQARFEREFRTLSTDLCRMPGRLPTRELDETWVPTWAELQPHLHHAVERLVSLNRSDEGVVLLVNSDVDRETPEYDADSSELGRWCVLVGGLMLSRGFTVEGLTTVYFRRMASAMDTQLQLARWNGYRNFFEDCVRLYFGVAEDAGPRRPPRDLYAEFQTSAVRDAVFRERLRRYGEDGSSPRIELPTFLEEKTASALRPTAAQKMRGVIRQTGAPIEYGRRGAGLPEAHPAIQGVAAAIHLTGFAEEAVCSTCAREGKAEALRVTAGGVDGEAVRGLLEVMLRSGAPNPPPDDQASVEHALEGGPWRLALLGMSRQPDDGYTPFGTLDVPVRRRTTTEYDTLSTGQWNRWMTVSVGDACPTCGQRTRGRDRPFLVLLPYVTTATATRDVRWGAMVQLPGRSGGAVVLVSRPSGLTAAGD